MISRIRERSSVCLVRSTGFNVDRYGENMSVLCVQYVYLILNPTFAGPFQFRWAIPASSPTGQSQHGGTSPSRTGERQSVVQEVVRQRVAETES